MKPKKSRFGISRKIALLLAVLLTVSTITAGVFSYAGYKNNSARLLGETALAIASSLDINGDEINRIMAAGEKDTGWIELRERLDFLKSSTGVSAVYVITKAENEYMFLALANTDILIGTPKTAATLNPATEAVFFTNMAAVSSVYYSSGEPAVTAYAPVFGSDGRITGAVGVDICAKNILLYARDFAVMISVIAAVLIAMLSVSAFFMTQRLVGRRVGLIADAAERLADGDFDFAAAAVPMSFINDEANRAALNLNNLKKTVGLLALGLPGYDGISTDAGKITGVFENIEQSISKSMSIVENIDALIYISDIKTHDLLFVNRKVVEMAEMTQEEILTKKCWQVMHKGMTAPCPFCPVPKLVAERDDVNIPPVYEREHYNRFSKKWFLTQGSLIKWADGRLAHFESATDITTLKMYEAGMKNLSAIVSAADAGIIVKDRRGIITEWNIGARNILGYEKAEMVGKTSKDFAPYEGHSIIDQTTLRLLKGEHITHIEEIRRHKDGHLIDLSISYTPILGDNEAVTGYVSIFHDISEKKKIEKERKALENTLMNLFDNLSNGFALFELYSNAEGGDGLRLLMANKAFIKFSSMARDDDSLEAEIETDELVSLPFGEVFGAAIDELPYYTTVARMGGGRTDETYNAKLGMYLSEVVFSPARGQIALLLTDRTHLVRAQESLQKREKDLAMLFGSMTAGFCMGKVILGDDGKPADIIYEIVNTAYETLEDYAPGTLLGKKMSVVSPSEFKRRFSLYADVALNHRKTSFTKFVMSKGKTLDVVCYSPEKGYFACIESDVTERVNKDEALKKAYRDTEAILSEIPAPICSVSRESGIILGCNKAFVGICGAEHEDELISEQIENYITGSNRVKMSSADTNKLLGSGMFKSFLKKRDNTYVEVEVFSRPFVYKEQIAYALCCIDMTQQKLQEEILREAATSAEETSRLKSMFLANMSHEIRTPMNGIIGLTELALDSAGLSEKSADYLSKIKVSAESLLAIINDILDISKIEAGKSELENTALMFGDVFKSCETMAGFKEKDKNVHLLFDCSDVSAEWVVGDPTKLRQIFMNLLSNALKFTNDGVVEFAAQIKKKTKNKITIHFSVTDTGIGMSAAQVSKIFEPFAQADVSTTRKYGGTGLGLTITNNLLEMMGGELSVESEQGKGSAFSFTLTFAIASETADKPAEAKAAISSGKRPVFNAEALVCEDNAINRQVIEEHLMRIGIIPIVAENGKIGVNMVRTRMRTGKPFDIILMDIHMPVMDGLEAMQKLIEAGSKTPVVAMTAGAMREDREMIIQSGMSDYICKPFTSQDLWDCLLRYLEPVSMEDVQMLEPGESRDVVLDEAAGLVKAAGDPALYKKIKADFYFDNLTTIESIDHALNEGNYKTARRLAHTLKGIATLIGAARLARAASVLEESYAIGEDNAKALEETKVRLDEVLEVLLPQVKSEKKTAVKKSGSQVKDIAKARKVITKLEPLLADGNAEASELINDIKEALPPELWGEMVSLMLDYEFDEALGALKSVKKKIEMSEVSE